MNNIWNHTIAQKNTLVKTPCHMDYFLYSQTTPEISEKLNGIDIYSSLVYFTYISSTSNQY